MVVNYIEKMPLFISALYKCEGDEIYVHASKEIEGTPKELSVLNLIFNESLTKPEGIIMD